MLQITQDLFGHACRWNPRLHADCGSAHGVRVVLPALAAAAMRSALEAGCRQRPQRVADYVTATAGKQSSRGRDGGPREVTFGVVDAVVEPCLDRGGLSDDPAQDRDLVTQLVG